MSSPIPKGRLRSLDALRGVAILVMVPLHILVFGMLLIPGGGGGSSDAWLGTLGGQIVDGNRPWGTGLFLFFFVSGMAIAATLAKKKGIQTYPQIAKRQILRYGSYMLIGIITEMIVWVVLFKAEPMSTLLGVVGQWNLGVSQPVISLAICVIISFTLILKLSWKKLAALGLTIFVAEYALLYFVPIPKEFYLLLFFFNDFAVFKALPIVLWGGIIAKLAFEGVKIKKLYIAISAAIGFAYFLIPTLLGTGGMHMLNLMWSYPHAILFIFGMGLFMFSLFQYLDEKKVRLTAFQVLGRNSFVVFYGHFIILGVIVVALTAMRISVTLNMLLAEMVITTSAIWVFLYFYSKRRWGNPSTW